MKEHEYRQIRPLLRMGIALLLFVTNRAEIESSHTAADMFLTELEMQPDWLERRAR